MANSHELYGNMLQSMNKKTNEKDERIKRLEARLAALREHFASVLPENRVSGNSLWFTKAREILGGE